MDLTKTGFLCDFRLSGAMSPFQNCYINALTLNRTTFCIHKSTVLADRICFCNTQLFLFLLSFKKGTATKSKVLSKFTHSEDNQHYHVRALLLGSHENFLSVKRLQP